MSLDPDLIGRLEELAGLALEPQERERARRHLASILAYVRKLQDLDTGGVAPCHHPVPLVMPYRGDEPEPSLDPATILSEAPGGPATYSGDQPPYFLVPAVLPRDGPGEPNV
jgi:aspartyl/glutamyl-tRNA(Asn/Gln) amidotransferase C subunit